jgi:hypothetical protein
VWRCHPALVAVVCLKTILVSCYLGKTQNRVGSGRALAALGGAGGGESFVRGAQHELPSKKASRVDAQLTDGVSPQEPVEGGLGLQRPRAARLACAG